MRRQQESVSKYQKEGYELDDTLDLSDKAISSWTGANLRKGKLRLFLDKIEDGTVAPDSILLVESLDRITRLNLLDAQMLFIDILRKGIKIVTLIDNQEYTQEEMIKYPHKIYGSISILSRAHEESQTKSIRLKETWIQKRKTIGKKFYTSRVPSWLERDGENVGFLVKKGCAETIQRMFRMVLDGDHCEGIAKKFRNEKIPVIGRRGIWGHSYIAITLRNRAVIGELQPCKMVDGKRQPDGPPIKNYYPPLVTKEDFDRVNLIMDGRTKNTAGRVGVQNIFKKMLKCGYCGSPMYRNRKGGDKYRKNGSTFYVCSKAKEKTGCYYYAWNAKEFESDFIGLSTELRSEMWSQENKRGLLADLELARSEKIQIQKQINRVTKILSDSDEPSRSLIKSLKEMEGEEDGLNSRIMEIERKYQESLYSGNPIDELENLMKKLDDSVVRSKASDVVARLFSEIILFPAGSRMQFAKIQSYAGKLEKDLPLDTVNRKNVISAKVRDYADRKKNRFFVAKLKRAGVGKRMVYPRNAFSAADFLELDDLPEGEDHKLLDSGDSLD